MSQNNGVDYLFNKLFHEVMEIHPVVRKLLDVKLAQLYKNYTTSQQEALDEVFSTLCHESFFDCFNVSAQIGAMWQREMMV